MVTTKVKNIRSIGMGKIYSIQNNEKNLYENTPNYIVNGLLSKNSKHACVYEEMHVLTNKGYKKIKDLTQTDKIAYIDSQGKMKLTKKFILHETGRKRTYKVKTSAGREIIITKDHELFKSIGNKISSEKLKSLEIGDKVLTV